jgi:teichoic acid transport system permease protein
VTAILARRGGNDFDTEVHVYEPHVVGLPPLGPYFRELWRRRQFALELSRSRLHARHVDTVFGQLWLVLNPLLLGFVYFLLVDILGRGHRGGGFLTHLLGNLFAFYFVSNAVSDGANSVTGGGKLILNTAFPRLLLPLSSVIVSFRRFLPTLLVYAVSHVVAHYPIGWHLLLLVPILVLLIIFATGAATVFATMQVYFRDTKDFLPYLLRVWLYISPVLYYAEDVKRLAPALRPILVFNPLYHLLGAWGEVLDGHVLPSLSTFLIGTAYAVGTLLAGCWLFLSREREFAVRI